MYDVLLNARGMVPSTLEQSGISLTEARVLAAPQYRDVQDRFLRGKGMLARRVVATQPALAKAGTAQ